MNKKELVAKIAASAGLTLKDAARALDSTINIIKEVLEGDKKSARALDSTISIIQEKPGKRSAKALDSTILLIRPEQKPPKKGRALDSTINMIPEHLVTAGKVAIFGFGTFYTVERKARIGRNPQTGAEIRIKARTVPKFKPSRQFIERING